MITQNVVQTNDYAKQHFNQQNKVQLTTDTHCTGSVQWKPLERIEFEAFIALLIQAGVPHANHESTNELWEISNNVPIYHATMSLRRFKDLLRFLRFAQQISQHFTPSENVTVDE